jgi:hypothetical protein
MLQSNPSGASLKQSSLSASRIQRRHACPASPFRSFYYGIHRMSIKYLQRRAEIKNEQAARERLLAKVADEERIGGSYEMK